MTADAKTKVIDCRRSPLHAGKDGVHTCAHSGIVLQHRMPVREEAKRFEETSRAMVADQ